MIVEAYGGGGNSGSTYKNDFIGLFNRGTTPVDVTGWSVQYASATGSSWQKTDLSGTIPAGGYFLVQEAAGSGGTVSLPIPDVTGTIPMGGSSFKVALVNNNTLLSGATPSSANVIDYVGAAASANWYEGSGPAPAPSNTNSVQRTSEGCDDTDDNAADFITAFPNPRNSSSPTHSCGAPVAPFITTQPQSTTNWPGSTATFTVVATGDLPLSYRWQSNSVDLVDGGKITGATSNVLAIANVDASDAASYTCLVSNLVGSTNSDIAMLTVSGPAPTIDSQPLSQNGILGATATFQVVASVAAQGAPAISYQWQSNNVDIADGGQFSGATTPKLTITGLTADNAAAYSCNVSNPGGTVPSGAASLSVGTTGTLSYWNFNVATNPASPEVYYGLGTASLAGTTNGFLVNGGNPYDSHTPTRYWGTASYPVQGTSNKTAGVRFDVSTVGIKNVSITLNTRLTSTSSKYSRLQYTTDGTTFTDFPASSAATTASGAWDYPGRTFNLAGFPGVRDNPNFGFRIVTEFQNTATYGTVANTNYYGLTSAYSPNGTVSYDTVTIAGEAITSANTPPTIAGLSDIAVLDTDSPTNLSFTIGDSETPGSLTVTAASFDETVLPDYNLAALASGTTGTLTVTPTPGVLGVAPVLVTVSDPDGNSATTWLYVTVNPGNFPPTISSIANTNTLVNEPITMPFTVNDDGGAANLTLITNSGNTTLVPNANITIGGSGSSRTITVADVAGASGVAPISIVAMDQAGKSATNTFTVMFRPSTNVLAVDRFDYDTAGSLNTNSAFLWQTHSGTAGQADVSGGVLNLMNPPNDSEDVNIPLIDEPWTTNSGAVLYSSFKATFLSFPGAGTYFAHYRDTNSGVATGFGARVIATTNYATAPDTFRLSIANGNGWTNSNPTFPLDLATNVPYTVVTRFVLSNGVATLWVNPSSESSPSLTASDEPTTNAVVNPINVVGYCFRQSTEFGGYGTVAVDDLVVGTSFSAVTGLPSGIPLEYTISGNDLILSWSDPTGLFSLASGTDITAVTNKVAGATSPYTNSITGTQKFFRLVYP